MRVTGRRRAAILGLAVVAAVPAPHSAGAQVGDGPVVLDDALLEGLQWRNVGPARAGRAVAAAGSAARPLEYYAGFAGGGLWKTVDGGTSWRPVTDGWIHSSSVGAVAVSESDPDVVYLGTGEVQIQRNSLQGDGVYGSRDGGGTWTRLGLHDSQVVSRIRVDPRDPDIVFAAVLGHPWGPSGERGVYRSRDGGATWQRVLYRDDRTGAVDLAIDPSDPDVVFAALWRATVHPGGSVTGGPGSGLFKSTDGGDTWTELSSAPGMPAGELGKIGVSVSGTDPNRVYALVEAEGGGVLRSDDGGGSWTLVNDEGPLRQRPPYFNRIVADPSDADAVYVLNLQLYRSGDGGETYEIVQTPHPDHHDLWIAAGDARRMISANDGGPTVSVTGGASWTRQDMPTAQLYNVGTTRDVPYHLCGPQQDEAAICVPSAQTRWRSASPYVGSGGLDGPWYAPGGGEFGTMAPHPADPDLFYATGPNVITLYDRRSGLVQARDIQPTPLSARGPEAERFTPFAPIVFSPVDMDVLYAGSQHVWRMRTSTLEWERISPDLTRGASSDVAGALLSIAPSPLDGETVWAGSDDGLVHVTRDGGRSWRDVTPPGLPAGAKVTSIAVSRHDEDLALVAATGYEIDDRTPYLFRSMDAGATWSSAVAGLGPDDFVRVVREDPTRPGLLYAGTEHGVRLSFDDGDSWQPLSLNLPDVSVSDLVVEGGDLVIATQGRSFWILEGAGVLREVSPATLASPLHLFTRGPVVRRLTPAVFDYLLARDADDVRVEVLDADGGVIRSYGGVAAGTGGGSAPRGATPPGRAGLNRFTWDLRYEPATVFEGMIMWVGTPEGPLAPPGRYRVRVSANGLTQSGDFEIVRDPAADVTDAELGAQFELALAARDGISTANRGVITIRALRPQIEDRLSRTGDDGVRSAGEALIRTLAEVEEQLYQVRLRSQLDAIVHPIRLNNRLANLKLSIETGDGRPTPQHYAAYDELAAALADQVARLDGTIDRLTDFNARLRGLGLDPVTVER